MGEPLDSTVDLDAEIAETKARLDALMRRKSLQGRRAGPEQAGPSLYAWQQEALAAWQSADHQGVVEAVTGAGKTRVGVAAIAEALGTGRRAVVLVPTRELVKQWKRNLASLLPRAVVTDRIGTPHRWDVTVTTVQAVLHRPVLAEGTQGLLVADEAHRYGAEQFSQALRNHYDWRLGLTATLERGDAGDARLDAFFKGACFKMGYQRALLDDLISPYRFAFAGVPLRASERTEYEELTEGLREVRSALVSRYDVPTEPIGDFLAAVAKMAEDRAHPGGSTARLFMSRFTRRKKLLAGSGMKMLVVAGLEPAISRSKGTIVFTQTTAASDLVKTTLVEVGCSAVSIHSEMTNPERDEAFELFRCGAVGTISAPRVLDEGVDVPEADLGVVLASNRSRRQMIQRLGRVLRKREGKVARFVVLYATGTVEDPTRGDSLPDFYDEIVPWAEKTQLFDIEAEGLDGLLGFLGVEDAPSSTEVHQEILEATGPSRTPTPMAPPGVTAGEPPDPTEDPHWEGRPTGSPSRPTAETNSMPLRPTVLPEGQLPQWQEFALFPRVTADTIKDYLVAIGRVPLLSAAAEVRLARCIEAGVLAAEALDSEMSSRTARRALLLLIEEGNRAFDHMVCANLRLVVSIAKRYAGQGLPCQDLIQEGNIGLIRAVQKFDYQVGTKFSTYATWWIRQSITRALADQARTIRLPVHVVEKLNSVDKMIRQEQSSWRQFLMDHPEGVPDLGVTFADLEYGARLWKPIASTDYLVEELGESFAPAPLAGTTRLPEPDDVIESMDLSVTLTRLWNRLDLTDGRLATVLQARAGMLTGEPETLDTIGIRLGVTRERIRQLEAKALGIARDELGIEPVGSPSSR